MLQHRSMAACTSTTTEVVTGRRTSDAPATFHLGAGMVAIDMGNALWVAATLICLSGTTANAAPHRPTSDDLVLLQSASSSSINPDLKALRQVLDADPRDIDSALKLARLTIAEGRRNGDPRYYGQAQAALAPWWADSKPLVDVAILRATINQAFHKFTPALADLDHVIALDPDNMQAHLSRAFILMVTGNHQSAAGDCTAITDPRAVLVREICRARLAALSGKGPEAFKQLQSLITASAGGNPTALAFAQTVLAEIAVSLGDMKTAEALFMQLSNNGDPDVAILAAHADLLLASDRAAEALALLENRGESDAVLLRQAIAAKNTSDPRLSDWTSILQERFAAAAASNNRVHLREEARFKLEVMSDANAALAIAIENWSTQKEPADAQVLLAAALAAGNSTASAPVRNFIATTGLDDARLNPLIKKLAGP